MQDRSFLEAKSEVEEQVPWLRNIFISGYAGYDRQLLPGEDIPWLCVGQGASTNGASIHRSLSSDAVIYLKTFSKRPHQ
ncbi:MAG: hypothetical protein DMG54_03930 [Acidobacteria bacterium]|nr:MAG: hypothetical protein DMG53_14185 [Acidobacteriota bacterium]PYU46242.1 MAG: hypothetical protein DMG54_03930 [Acidobacteriota bacterium]PYU73739.1 MAG: hypothetical protein DMG52_13840 [Acidobacteriota bacterium]